MKNSIDIEIEDNKIDIEVDDTETNFDIGKEEDTDFEIPHSVVINNIWPEVKEYQQWDEYLYRRAKWGERQELVSIEALKGSKWEKGVNGDDWYTPIKWVDYFDWNDGKPWKDGKNGEDGKDAYEMFIEQGGEDIGRQSFLEILRRNIEANWTIIGGNNWIQSIIAWSNTTVDNTDPRNPIISSTGWGWWGIESVVAWTNISVDNTDPLNPIVSSLSDRYKTTSTTSQAIVSTGTLTFTVWADLAYTPQQDVIIAYDSSNHMHWSVVSYSGTTLVVDIQHKTWSGTYTSWVINLDAINAPQTFTSLTDAPASYTWEAGKVVAVNGTEDWLEFITPSSGWTPWWLENQIQINDWAGWFSWSSWLTYDWSQFVAAVPWEFWVFLVTWDNWLDVRFWADWAEFTSNQYITFFSGIEADFFAPVFKFSSTAWSINAILDVDTLTADRNISFPDASWTIALTSNLSDYAPLSWATFTGNIIAPILEVDDDTYWVWRDGNLEVPTKNAIYDKIETLSWWGGWSSTPYEMSRQTRYLPL